MTKHVVTALLVLSIVTSTGWSKIKKDDQEYFDSQFEQLKAQIKTLQDHNKVLAEQLSKVDAELTQLQKAQTDAAELIHRDGGFLEEVNQSLRMNQMTHEQDANTMKQILGLLQGVREQLAASQPAGGAPAAAVIVPPQGAAVQSAPPQSGQPMNTVLSAATPRAYYVAAIDGEKYILGVGSAQGVLKGSKLAVYKRSAPTARIGELEVTDLVDENTCQARVAGSLNPGATIEANDIVQIVQLQ